MNLLQKLMLGFVGVGILLVAVPKIIIDGQLFEDPFSPVLLMLGLGGALWMIRLMGDPPDGQKSSRKRR